MPNREVQLVVDRSMRGLCRRPYYNHKDGCPNWGKKEGCPPHAPTVDEILDLTRPTWVIWNIFDFRSHCRRMRERHPEWTERQVRCCLYWQPRARKQLREEIKEFYMNHRDARIVGNPEAAGVNVTKTMAKIGERLQWPPETVTYQVAVAGYEKGETDGN